MDVRDFLAGARSVRLPQAEAIRLERVPDGAGDAHGDGHQRSTHLVVELEEVSTCRVGMTSTCSA